MNLPGPVRGIKVQVGQEGVDGDVDAVAALNRQPSGLVQDHEVGLHVQHPALHDGRQLRLQLRHVWAWGKTRPRSSYQFLPDPCSMVPSGRPNLQQHTARHALHIAGQHAGSQHVQPCARVLCTVEKDRAALWGCLAGAACGAAACLGMSRRAPGGSSALGDTLRSAPPSATLIRRARVSFRRAPSDICGPRRLSHCRAARATRVRHMLPHAARKLLKGDAFVLRGDTSTDLWAQATPLRI